MSSEARLVEIAVNDGVASLMLNRPENGNAIDVPMAAALRSALSACLNDSRLRAIVISGAGRMFCSGGSLKTIQGAGEQSPAYVRDILFHLHDAIGIIARIPVPVIAQVHGSAAGAGFALAMSCDFVVAAKSARFLMAYTAVGLTPDGSSSYFLPRLIGLRRSLELTLRNRALSAEEAADWGIVNEIVDDEMLAKSVAGLAVELAAGPTAAFGAAKRLLRASYNNDLDAQMTLECETLCDALTKPEAAIGLAAFAAKQRPKFR